MNIKKFSLIKNIPNTFNRYFTKPIRIENICDGFIQDVYKTRCIDALKGQEPYEHVILLNKKSGKLIKEFFGNNSSCGIDIPNIKSPMILLHGHPEKGGNSLPVSIQDFIILNNNKNLDKIVAYNINGQQSFIQKKQNFVSLDKKEIAKLEGQYIAFFIEQLPKAERDKIKPLIEYCMKNSNATMVKQQLADLLNDLQHQYPKIVEDFWIENSGNLNLEYFSNMFL